MRRLLADITLTAALLVVATLLALNLSAMRGTVQAANPAPPESKPCVEVNTASMSNGVVIVIFRCEPEGAPPYKINSFGFMLVEE